MTVPSVIVVVITTQVAPTLVACVTVHILSVLSAGRYLGV